MLLRKEGFPNEGELVLCTITRIQTHGVFVNIDEYAKQGMIHISEIAPGRIRNMRDFVKEGKVVVCSVLKINQERGYIDLSLRRVSDTQRRNKINAIKQEQKAEKIIDHLAKELKRDIKELYREISEKVFQKYISIYGCFEDVVTEKTSVSELGINKGYSKRLEELVKERIKPPVVYIGGKLSISSYEPNGVEIVKLSLKKAEEKGKDALDIKYLGGGKYQLLVKAEEYKEAEKILKESIEAAEHAVKKTNTTISFAREVKRIKKDA